MPSITVVPLPLIPKQVLRQHHAFEPHDTRFRAAARLIQSLWRQRQELEIGSLRTRKGGYRKLGSRLIPDDAATGRTFLHPSIAAVARHQLAYRERGALIAEERLMGNLLCSQGLAFNLFAPLRLDLDRAAAMLRRLLPKADIAKVRHIGFEHSPGRDEPAFTNDKTAFDVAISYLRSDGGTGLIAIEVKYSESLADQAPLEMRRYDQLAEASGLFRTAAVTLMTAGRYRQLAREHLLAQVTVMNGLYDEAHFIMIAPSDNHLVNRAAGLYAAHLAPTLPGMVPFTFIELETVIDAYGRCGDLGYAAALADRYTRWDQVHALVREALLCPQDQWSLVPPTPKRRIRRLTAQPHL